MGKTVFQCSADTFSLVPKDKGSAWKGKAKSEGLN